MSFDVRVTIDGHGVGRLLEWHAIRNIDRFTFAIRLVLDGFDAIACEFGQQYNVAFVGADAHTQHIQSFVGTLYEWRITPHEGRMCTDWTVHDADIYSHYGAPVWRAPQEPRQSLGDTFRYMHMAERDAPDSTQHTDGTPLTYEEWAAKVDALLDEWKEKPQ